MIKNFYLFKIILIKIRKIYIWSETNHQIKNINKNFQNKIINKLKILYNNNKLTTINNSKLHNQNKITKPINLNKIFMTFNNNNNFNNNNCYMNNKFWNSNNGFKNSNNFPKEIKAKINKIKIIQKTLINYKKVNKL
jgi:hypothetical protein